jgi:hypothetical protein
VLRGDGLQKYDNKIIYFMIGIIVSKQTAAQIKILMLNNYKILNPQKEVPHPEV